MRRPLYCSHFISSLLLSLLMAVLSGHSVAGAPQPGQPVADFTLPALDGETRHALSDFRGQVVYLDFWASWCGPCRLSLPALDELYRELGPKGFTVLAVNVDAYRDEATDFLASYPVGYPVLRDDDRALPKKFGVKGMPTAFLIDQQGQLVGVHEGFRKGDADKLRRKVMHLLEAGRGSQIIAHQEHSCRVVGDHSQWLQHAACRSLGAGLPGAARNGLGP